MVGLQLTVFFVVLCALSTQAQQFTFVASEAPDLDAAFYPQQQGWLGADSSASLQLNNSAYLWLFADTFMGTMVTLNGQPQRNIQAGAHSSVAFVDPAQNKPDFWYRLNSDGSVNNMGIFSPQNPTVQGEFYWLVAGIIGPASGQLIVLAQATASSSGGLGFTNIGTDAIVVSNPQAEPWLWNYTTSRITQTSTTLSLNTGITFSDGYFYLLGLCNSNSIFSCHDEAVLARITEKSLLSYQWDDMQFWGALRIWQSSTVGLHKLYKSTYTEGTIQYHDYMKVYLQTAPEITGPWTTTVVYEVPAPYNNTDVYFAYAAKSHPEYAQENEIVFTYNINSAKGLAPLTTEVDIYHPKFVRLTISPQLESL